MANIDWYGYSVRFEAAKEFLSGHGFEIGAGASPQRLPDGAKASYFDKRNSDELANHFRTDIGYAVHDVGEIATIFPDGADFLVAHQVLEHIHDHVGALSSWYSHLKDGAVVVLSVPDKDGLRHDEPRPTTPLRHILEDYALERDAQSFETKEHVGSFCLGWSTTWPDLDRDQFAKRALKHMNSESNDLHWHANDRTTWDGIVALSLILSSVGAEVLRIVDMRSEPPLRTQGEIIYIYRIRKTSRAIVGLPPIEECLQKSANALQKAANMISALADYAVSLDREI